jgi:hypothetical protein
MARRAHAEADIQALADLEALSGSLDQPILDLIESAHVLTAHVLRSARPGELPDDSATRALGDYLASLALVHNRIGSCKSQSSQGEVIEKRILQSLSDYAALGRRVQMAFQDAHRQSTGPQSPNIPHDCDACARTSTNRVRLCPAHSRENDDQAGRSRPALRERGGCRQ